MTRYVLDHLPADDRPAARSSSSIAAATCFISTRSRARRSAPMPRRSIAAGDSRRNPSRASRNPAFKQIRPLSQGRRLSPSHLEFEHVKADVAVDDVNQPTLVEHHIVALRRGTAADRLGNEKADFARRRSDRRRRRCADRRRTTPHAPACRSCARGTDARRSARPACGRTANRARSPRTATAASRLNNR